MIIKGVKHLVYNDIKEMLIITFENGDVKRIDVERSEYEDALKTGNFSKFLES